VRPTDEYPADIDVLIAVLPSTLQPDQVEKLAEYVKSGKPALIAVDPLPAFNIELSPQQTPPNPFMQQAPQRVPADLTPIMDALGVEWPIGDIAWDRYNPHPQYRSLPPEVVFIAPGSEAEAAFNFRVLLGSSDKHLPQVDSRRRVSDCGQGFRSFELKVPCPARPGPPKHYEFPHQSQSQ
jgi:hypothetical protein